MTLIHESSANEKFGQNKHCRHYVHSTYAIGPLWSHVLRGWKRCHALLEREIWQIVAYPLSFLMSNTCTDLSLKCTIFWLRMASLLKNFMIWCHHVWWWTPQEEDEAPRRRKRRGRKKAQFDGSPCGTGKLPCMVRISCRYNWMYLWVFLIGKGLMTDCETRSRCRTDNRNIWKSLVPVARSWQERVASSDQRPTVLCVIVCCWMLLLIVIVPSTLHSSLCKQVQKKSVIAHPLVLVHDANIYGMRCHIELT